MTGAAAAPYAFVNLGGSLISGLDSWQQN